MGVSIGYRLRLATVFFTITALFLISLACTQPLKAEARANLTAYLTAGPSVWEPERYNVAGTSPWFVTHTLGYNNTLLMGNLGIGDGTVRTLNRTSNQDIEYSENYFIGADISTAPWNASRITSPAEEENASRANKTTSKKAVPSPSAYDSTGDTASEESSHTGKAGAQEANNTSSIGNIGPGMKLNDIYHPILMGRPVSDMIYEYPLGIIGGMYARLLGLNMPGGSVVNMGIRCLGYGY